MRVRRNNAGDHMKELVNCASQLEEEDDEDLSFDENDVNSDEISDGYDSDFNSDEESDELRSDIELDEMSEVNPHLKEHLMEKKEEKRKRVMIASIKNPTISLTTSTLKNLRTKFQIRNANSTEIGELKELKKNISSFTPTQKNYMAYGDNSDDDGDEDDEEDNSDDEIEDIGDEKKKLKRLMGKRIGLRNSTTLKRKETELNRLRRKQLQMDKFHKLQKKRQESKKIRNRHMASLDENCRKRENRKALSQTEQMAEARYTEIANKLSLEKFRKSEIENRQLMRKEKRQKYFLKLSKSIIYRLNQQNYSVIIFGSSDLFHSKFDQWRNTSKMYYDYEKRLQCLQMTIDKLYSNNSNLLKSYLSKLEFQPKSRASFKLQSTKIPKEVRKKNLMKSFQLLQVEQIVKNILPQHLKKTFHPISSCNVLKTQYYLNESNKSSDIPLEPPSAKYRDPSSGFGFDTALEYRVLNLMKKYVKLQSIK
ncbi:hypothetical protein SNEBB_008604 [Seison nebaliae]|nr:hypothetical protein SNEBB_008604 [Seison nebaliae]